MSENILHFQFDVSTFRLLGRELITDRITALFELVKNCYDANSEQVYIDFVEVNPLNANSAIIIKDDGLGMTFEDIRDKWMVIGTSSKRKKTHSPAPYNRKVVGKKGVGRFAVDKLGARLLLKTKMKGSDKLICLETDWRIYSQEEERQLKLPFENESRKLFTDIDNKYWFEEASKELHGTTLEISALNDVWTKEDILRASKELSKIVRPSLRLEYPFQIYINAPQFGFSKEEIKSKIFSRATLSYTLDFNLKSNTQEILKFDKGKLIVAVVPFYNFGPVRFSLFYYDKDAKGRYRVSTSSEDKIDGIKVYRDGLIATPFAEYKESTDERKDLFGIDKRRWSGFFEKLSTRDLIGFVDITEEYNPQIIDSTNRQDFVDNKEWNSLKKFVIDQIHQIEKYIQYNKEAQKNEARERLKNADKDLETIKPRLDRLKSIPFIDLASEKVIDSIVEDVKGLQSALKKGVTDYKKLEAEKEQQENVMFSLVSLQTYASMLSHIVRTSIGRIKRSAAFVAKWVPTGEQENNCIKHSTFVRDEMERLSKAVDFMLSYAKDDKSFEDIRVKDVLEDIFYNVYATTFEQKRVKVMLELNENFILHYNLKSFEDMFGNLIDNALKALDGVPDKIIKCSGYKEEGQLILYFSDSGCGIELAEWERVFDVFYTTTASQGGAGLGLYIVKTRLEAINGSIEVIENELKPRGTTFKIILPFKKTI